MMFSPEETSAARYFSVSAFSQMLLAKLIPSATKTDS
jgi:hypothetical protein